MNLKFKIGDPAKPRGHVVVYFKTSGTKETLLATYVVIMPITMDFAKYVPPVLAPHLGNFSSKDDSVFALPPIPEEVESYDQLVHMAHLRDDDLVFAGEIDNSDVDKIMHQVSDVAGEYGHLWEVYASACQLEKHALADNQLGVNDVVYSLMSHADLLNELSSMVTNLRSALSNEDYKLAADVEEMIPTLTKYLPSHYRINDLMKAARDMSTRGDQLAILYLERCNKLAAGDSNTTANLEAEIRLLESAE